MTNAATAPIMLSAFDDDTRALVRLSAIITCGDEVAVRRALSAAGQAIPAIWVEELILQSYLFAGFPRALNAMREWRRVESSAGERLMDQTRPDVPSVDVGLNDSEVRDWRERGERTCAAVYGGMYERLRMNVRELHPALDDWMVVDGYGKVLSRPGLDLPRRELCIVAACAASRQDRQLHSHLHGAVNVGVSPQVVNEAIEALADIVGENEMVAARMLWSRVRGK